MAKNGAVKRVEVDELLDRIGRLENHNKALKSRIKLFEDRDETVRYDDKVVDIRLGQFCVVETSRSMWQRIDCEDVTDDVPLVNFLSGKVVYYGKDTECFIIK